MNVYKITNKVNGKIYVGKTVGDIEIRFNQHCRKSSGCHKLRNAISKYGRVNFTIETIDTADNTNELNKKEIFWISEMNSVKDGYNLTFGGDGGAGSKETIEKIRKSKIGNKASLKTRAIMSKMRLGGNNPKAKRVEVVWPDKVIKEYNCLADACRELNINYSPARSIAGGYNKNTRNGLKFNYLE